MLISRDVSCLTVRSIVFFALTLSISRSCQKKKGNAAQRVFSPISHQQKKKSPSNTGMLLLSWDFKKKKYSCACAKIQVGSPEVRSREDESSAKTAKRHHYEIFSPIKY